MVILKEQMIEIKVIVRDRDNSLVRLLDYLKIANSGHSFEVIVDPESKEYKKTFWIDGDGTFFIKKILKNGKEVKVENDKIIEGYLKLIQ